MRDNKPIVQAEGISFSYNKGQTKVLDNITLSLAEGRISSLTGSSGCGKSTLTHALCGVIPHGIQGVFQGRVLIDGEDSKELTLPQIAKKVGIVFQDVENQLFLPTVEEEIAFALENYCCPIEKIRDTVNSILMLLQIEHLRYRNPSTLSGGEKRLAAIGAVLSMNPDCLIMDEPFSGLDEYNCIMIWQVINGLKAQGKTILLVEHDITQLELSDELYVMSEGRITNKVEGAGVHGFLQDGFGEVLLSKTSKAV